MKKFSGAHITDAGSPSSLLTAAAIRSPSSDGSPIFGDKVQQGSEDTFDQFCDKIEDWYRSLDVRFNAAIAARDERVSCHTCPHTEPGCCFQKTVMPFFEAFPIVRWIIENKLDSPEFREQLRTTGEAMEGASRDTWFHEAHPCVFLKGGRCSIYPVRPVGCRTYWVINDPADCQPGMHNGIRHLNNEKIFEEEFHAAAQAHEALDLKQSMHRIIMGTMPRAIWILMEALDDKQTIPFAKFVRSQIWPTADDIGDDWIDGRGRVPFKERLYQIRKKQDVPHPGG